MTMRWKLSKLLTLAALSLVSLQPVLANGDQEQSTDDNSTVIDSDGDGYMDCVEKGQYRDDQDNDGVDDSEDDTVDDLQSTTDHDADGIPDYVEKGEYRNNHDNTGKHDSEDLDDDDDGVRDRTESAADKKDHDNSGKADKNDLDDDNDGTEDLSEATCGEVLDHDNDGTKDRTDSDDDNDGVEDDVDEHLEDHDNDGIEDREDSDDDNDGIEDSVDSHLDDHDNDGIEDNQDSSDDGVETVEVEIEHSEFSPADLTIQVGDSVTFTNKDNMVHTASAVDASFTTGDLLEDESYTVTFDEAGTYDYYCFYHSSMTGTITVE